MGSEPAALSNSAQVSLRWGVKIPVRDGVNLTATLYLPKRQSTPSPAIFAPTPYVADTHHQRGVNFAAKGFPFLLVDVRGRGNSEGSFQPHLQEAKDGYDVVEWLAHQPYCNGQVTMWGGSYAGYSQWATAKEFPPHLATIVPAAAPYIGVDVPMRNNIFYPYFIQWLLFTSGRASQANIFADRAFWSAIYREWYESGRPFREVDAVFGNPSPIFQEWLDHPEPDDYWDACNPTAEEYARIDIPILTITGIYDDDQPGALEHHRQHLRNAAPGARARHYLVVGPWDHLGTGMPCAEFGGLKVGAEGLVDLLNLHLEWFAWTMQGGPKPTFLKARVSYYVLGADQWRYADTLEEVTAGYDTYFLDSTGHANDVFSTGSLGLVPADGQPDSYLYDPREVGGPEVEAEARADGGSLVDQSVLLALRGRLFVYHSAPFERDIEISGFFRLSAWIAIDCPDTDFYASVHEIDLSGASLRLSTDALRARYREGLRTPKPIRTRDPLRYDFERFTFVSRRISQGHRLRLVIAPIGRLVETTFAQKNYNAGGLVTEESAQDARAVTVRLFHDQTHPSALYVPLGRAEISDEGKTSRPHGS
jgi:putative CocE/NonD family hydrolase